MSYAAIVVALCALGFTVGSFWWLHARAGSVEAAEPGAYCFGTSDTLGVRLQLPLALYNSGARARVVADLRLVVVTDSARAPIGWIATVSKLASSNDRRFATPFAIHGRSTREIVAEFGGDTRWRPDPLRRQLLTLEARLHPSRHWTEIETFDWWPPPGAADTERYLAYRNEPAP